MQMIARFCSCYFARMLIKFKIDVTNYWFAFTSVLHVVSVMYFVAVDYRVAVKTRTLTVESTC